MPAMLWIELWQLTDYQMKDSVDKIYYKIRDVAEFISENPSTIRYWEKEFNIVNPVRSNGGTRYYTKRDIENLKKIKYLIRTQGLKIEAAKFQLKNNISNVSSKFQAIELMENIKEDLQALLNALKMRK